MAKRTKAKFPLDHEPEAVTWAREAAGLTKTELAARVGVTLSLISEIERGTRNAGPELIGKIAAALNCPVAMLERGHWRPTEVVLMDGVQLDCAKVTLFAQTQSAIEAARAAAERERDTFMDLYLKVRPLMTGPGVTVADALIRLAKDGVAA